MHVLDNDELALVFNLKRHSAFSFKCMRCSVCCVNRTIPVNPYEASRLSRRLGISKVEFFARYTEGQERILRLKADASCIFLTDQGCGVHRDRPLVCRLFPLGLLSGPDGDERYSRMPPHPDCLGLFGEDGTVASYFASQKAGPFLARERRLRERRSVKKPRRSSSRKRGISNREPGSPGRKIPRAG